MKKDRIIDIGIFVSLMCTLQIFDLHRLYNDYHNKLTSTMSYIY